VTAEFLGATIEDVWRELDPLARPYVTHTETLVALQRATVHLNPILQEWTSGCLPMKIAAAQVTARLAARLLAELVAEENRRGVPRRALEGGR